MFVRCISRRRLKIIWQTAGICLLSFCFLRWQTALANGIRQGLSVCSTTVIPSLFPFMILTGIVAGSPLCRTKSRVFRQIGWLFGLPACCVPAVIMSLIGGYPSGAIAVSRLVKDGRITRDEARRMLCFCVNAGPGFLIGTVGNGLLGNAKAGILLYCSHVAVSLVMGIITGFGHREHLSPAEPVASPAVPFADTVRDTCVSLLTMCGFILLCCAALSVSDAAGIFLLLQRTTGIGAGFFHALTAGVCEVSCGCIAAIGLPGGVPFLISLFLGWGGLSVHGQLAAVLPGMRLTDGDFLFWRVCHGMASGFLSLLLFRLFPCSVSTATVGERMSLFSVSARSSVMLLLFCFLAMLTFTGKGDDRLRRKTTGKNL